MIPILFGRSNPKITIDANTNIIIDGNSIYTVIGGEPMDIMLSRIAPFFGSGCSFVNLSYPGRTWTDLRTLGGDVDDAYVEGKTNILITGETTNEAWSTNKTGLEIWDVASGYFADRKEAHPDLRTVICGSIPFYYYVAPGQTVARNQTMMDFDTLMRANYRGVVDTYADYRRASMPWFNHDASQLSYFSDYPDIWIDEYVHPSEEGKEGMASEIARAVMTLREV